MFRIKCLNAISKVGTDSFLKNYGLTEDLQQADGILVRSADMKEMEIPENVLTIARAGAGVNNIPLEKCAEQGIVVFNTPGANANSVKELVLCAMLVSARNVIPGVEWVRSIADSATVAKDCEKGKKQFVGSEIRGKKLGVIGLGAIGAEVANAAIDLGMDVYGYDPYLSVNGAWRLSREVRHATSLNELCAVCDYITVHVPLTDKNPGMISKECIDDMKEGVVLLNFSRDKLVDENALAMALASGKVKAYFTDYLDNGNIRHSVNYPDCEMGVCTSVDRIAILHKNIPNMLGQFTGILAKYQQNIANMMNKSRDKVAYTLIDLDSEVSEECLAELRAVDAVIRVRVVK